MSLDDQRIVEIATAAAVAALQSDPLPALSVDQYLSTEELGRYVRRDSETVRRWIAKGLPAKKVEGSWLIRWGDWLAWDADDEMVHELADLRRRMA